MAVHDWTRVDAGIFHHFHGLWITELSNALNRDLLPSDFYALTEQHAGRAVADLLTLHTSRADEGPVSDTTRGGLALAEAPPRVRHRLTAPQSYRMLQRSLAIRHVSGHRLVALLEIVSPANKDRPESVGALVGKAGEFLEHGVHLLLVDLLPPGLHDPRGIHGALWSQYDEAAYEVPADEPLTAASYLAGPRLQAFVEHLAVGQPVPEMPLFLLSERYVQCPLQSAYDVAYDGVPRYWREVLDGGRVHPG